MRSPISRSGEVNGANCGRLARCSPYWELALWRDFDRIAAGAGMRLLYCWRCRREAPMLTEEEYQFVMSFLSAESGVPFGERQQLALEAYCQITGERETRFPIL